MTDLSLGCTISLPLGGTLNLNDHSAYALEASARNERQVQHRKQQAKNVFVEGEWTVSSVRENVTETLAWWVYGLTALELRTRIDTLCSALDQIQYTIVFSEDSLDETWTCQTADYTVKSSGPLMKARMALVSAQIPRLPSVVLS